MRHTRGPRIEPMVPHFAIHVSAPWQNNRSSPDVVATIARKLTEGGEYKVTALNISPEAIFVEAIPKTRDMHEMSAIDAYSKVHHEIEAIVAQVWADHVKPPKFESGEFVPVKGE